MQSLEFLFDESTDQLYQLSKPTQQWWQYPRLTKQHLCQVVRFSNYPVETNIAPIQMTLADVLIDGVIIMVLCLSKRSNNTTRKENTSDTNDTTTLRQQTDKLPHDI